MQDSAEVSSGPSAGCQHDERCSVLSEDCSRSHYCSLLTVTASLLHSFTASLARELMCSSLVSGHSHWGLQFLHRSQPLCLVSSLQQGWRHSVVAGPGYLAPDTGQRETGFWWLLAAGCWLVNGQWWLGNGQWFNWLFVAGG